jgi:hypothetical protein
VSSEATKKLLKTVNFKSLTRKPSYSSFFSAWYNDFKNVIFENIHWAPSEVIEVKRSFLRSLRPNFGFHLVFTSFHLEILAFCVSRSFDLSNLGDLRRGLKYMRSKEKDELCHSFLVKIFTKSLHRGVCAEDLKKSPVRHFLFFQITLRSKLYIPSTQNIDLILWHTQLIVCAVKC